MSASPAPSSAERGPLPPYLWPPGVFLAVLVSGFVIAWWIPCPMARAWPARALGVGAILAAGTLAIRAKRGMDEVGTHIHPWKPTHALVTAGPFAHTRNPMYTALCLLHAGIGLLRADWGMVLMTLVLWVALWGLVVAREERYLAACLGEPYRAYCRRVPRWGWRLRR